MKDYLAFFFSSRRRHTRFSRDWSSDVCSSDLGGDGDDLAGLRVADGAGLAVDGLEDAEAGEGDALAGGHSHGDNGGEGVDHAGGGLLVEVSVSGDLDDELGLGHLCFSLSFSCFLRQVVEVRGLMAPHQQIQVDAVPGGSQMRVTPDTPWPSKRGTRAGCTS